MDTASIVSSVAGQIIERFISSNSAANINIGCHQTFQVAGGDAALSGSGPIYSKNIFETKWDDLEEEHKNLSITAKQLSDIRLKLKAKSDITPEEELAICAIAAAENSAIKGDGAGVLRHLNKLKPLSSPLTTFILSFTASTGANIAAHLIKIALGLS